MKTFLASIFALVALTAWHVVAPCLFTLLGGLVLGLVVLYLGGCYFDQVDR